MCTKFNILHFLVYITWNGTRVTNASLVYYDEISSGHGPIVGGRATDKIDEPDSGTLVCRSQVRRKLTWHFPNGNRVNNQRIASLEHLHRSPYIVRIQRNRRDDPTPESDESGLWTCRDNGNINGAVHVAVFDRGGKVYMSPLGVNSLVQVDKFMRTVSWALRWPSNTQDSTYVPL